jgi:hypothetical protein
MKLNLSNSVPEANPVVQKAAEVFHKHFQSALIGIILHGSAFKGGYIAGSSDIDFQLYLEESAFTSNGQLPLDLCIAIHKDLSVIDPYPFHYIQSRALSVNLPSGYVGPISGAYQLVYGELPVKEATNLEIKAMSVSALTNLSPIPGYLTEGLLEHGGMRLARIVRLLCTEVSPVLYQFLSTQNDDAIRIWGLAKDEAIELLTTRPQLKISIEQFYKSVKAYYPTETNIDLAMDIIRSGTAFLTLIKAAWDFPTLLGARK